MSEPGLGDSGRLRCERFWTGAIQGADWEFAGRQSTSVYSGVLMAINGMKIDEDNDGIICLHGGRCDLR